MSVNRREKALIGLGIVIILALAYIMLVVSPASSRRKALERYIAKKEADFSEICTLRSEWEGFQKRRAEAERIMKGRGQRFTLLSYLEGITRKLGINTKIHYMKPLSFSDEKSGNIRTEGIEIKLDGISSRDLIPLLQQIEYAGKLLSIKRIKIQKVSKDKDEYLKITLQVHTYSST